MRTEENDFTKQLLAYLKATGWKAVHFRPGMMANGRWITPYLGEGKGFPDIVAVRGKDIIFAELKTDTGEMSDEQLDWMIALSATGARCFMWTPARWDEIKEVLA